MDSPHRPLSEESITQSDEKSKPWKYIGYKVFSRWMASDQTFFILRRFGALNARVALSLQDEIVELEEKLDFMDKMYSGRDAPDSNNGSFRDDPFRDPEERRDLVRKILPEKLRQYNSFINGYAQLASRGSVDPHDVKTVRLWLKEIRPKAINGHEAAYIDHDGDLVPILPKSRSPFRKFLEDMSILKAPVLRRFFSHEPPPDIIDLKNEGTTWVHHDRVDKLSATIISLAGLFMLIGPLWILAYVHPTKIRLIIISSFIVLFFILVNIATTARTYESIAAAAAYSAVLMVFLQGSVVINS